MDVSSSVARFSIVGILTSKLLSWNPCTDTVQIWCIPKYTINLYTQITLTIKCALLSLLVKSKSTTVLLLDEASAASLQQTWHAVCTNTLVCTETLCITHLRRCE